MSKMSTDAPRRVSLNGPTMGSRWTALWFDDGTDDPMPIGRALVDSVAAVDAAMSTWKPESELMRLNRAPVGKWIDLSPALATVLHAALDIGRLSDGAFDIGVGRLVADWGFGAGEMAGLGAGSLSLDLLEVDLAGSRALKHAAMALDLSGIAKGYGVDELARCLDRAGISSYLVGIDGEMRARGTRPDGEAWTVAVEAPEAGRRDIRSVLTLQNGAIATSGDYRQRRMLSGKAISHSMDPRTGRPVENTVASVSVLAGDAMSADAWATALLVLGADAGLRLARQLTLDMLMLVRDDDGAVRDIGCGAFAGNLKHDHF